MTKKANSGGDAAPAIEIDRDALLGALKRVADVVEARTTIPVLSNVLMVAANDVLTVTATDLNLQATARAPASGSPLSITAEKSKLIAAVQSLPTGTLTVAMEDARLTIRQKRRVRTISTLPAADFPDKAEPENATQFALPAASLLRMLDSCAPAISTEETRYYLNGIFVHLVGGELRFAATDGLRLIRAAMPAPEGLDSLADAILPAKTVHLLRKLLGHAGGDVAIAMGAKSVRFAVGDTRIIANLIEGSFPDYARVIPPDADRTVTLAREALIEPAMAAAQVVNAEGDKIKRRALAIECKADGDHELRARDTSGAFACEPLDATLTGEPILIGVNHQFLVQAARIFAESAVLSLSMESDVAQIKMTSDKDPDLLAVIMPMRP